MHVFSFRNVCTADVAYHGSCHKSGGLADVPRGVHDASASLRLPDHWRGGGKLAACRQGHQVSVRPASELQGKRDFYSIALEQSSVLIVGSIV